MPFSLFMFISFFCSWYSSGVLATSAAIPLVEAAPAKDIFQTLANRDSFGPTDARLMSTHPFAA
jgi:hypothetical protein